MTAGITGKNNTNKGQNWFGPLSINGPDLHPSCIPATDGYLASSGFSGDNHPVLQRSLDSKKSLWMPLPKRPAAD
jgi:hypothetical protein